MNGGEPRIVALIVMLLAIAWVAAITFGVYKALSLAIKMGHFKPKKPAPPKEEERKKIDFLA